MKKQREFLNQFKFQRGVDRFDSFVFHLNIFIYGFVERSQIFMRLLDNSLSLCLNNFNLSNDNMTRIAKSCFLIIQDK